jgi:hypothetical protein
MDIETLLLNNTATIVYIVASAGIITAILKQVGVISRWLPLISFVFGFGFGVFIFGYDAVGIIASVVIGGSASGIYDLGKKTLLGK